MAGIVVSILGLVVVIVGLIIKLTTFITEIRMWVDEMKRERKVIRRLPFLEIRVSNIEKRLDISHTELPDSYDAE